MADENIVVNPVCIGDSETSAVAAGISTLGATSAVSETTSADSVSGLAKHKKTVCALIFTVVLVIIVVAALPFIGGKDSAASTNSSQATVQLSYVNRTKITVDVADGAVTHAPLAPAPLLPPALPPPRDGPTTTITTTVPLPPCAFLQVVASGFESTAGVARLFLHTAESSWKVSYGMTNLAFMQSSKAIESGTVSWNLGVPQGTYAVMVLDDKDGNGRMKKNWLGIPKEGVGSSRGAKGGPFGGPKFDNAKVTIECNQSLILTVDLWAI